MSKLKALGLNKSSKIFVFVRDYSLDAAIALINLKNVFENVEHVFIKYSVVDYRVDDLRLKNYDFIFFLGVAPFYKDKLDKWGNCVVLCNQENYKHIHDIENCYYVSLHTSTAILTMKFLTSYFQVDLHHLDDMNQLSYDFVFQNWQENVLSLYMKWLFDSFSRDTFLTRFLSGVLNLTDEEKQIVKEKKSKFLIEYESINKKELSNNICYIENSNFVEEICYQILRRSEYKFVFCNLGNNRICIRTNHSEINLGELVSQFPESGGMAKAASFKFKNEEEFIERIQLLVNLIEGVLRKG